MRKRVIKLTESDLRKIVERVVAEQKVKNSYSNQYIESKNIIEQGSADINIDRVIREQLSQAPETKSAPQKMDIKSTKFPCFTTTSVPYDYNPKRGDVAAYYAPAKMNYLRLFQDNSIIVAWENNTIKQYVRNGNSAGAETKKGTWKCKANNSGVDVVMTDSVVKKQTPSGPIAVTDQKIIQSLKFEYNYPGDVNYIYAKLNGNWYGKNIKNNKIFDITKNYPATAKNLDSKAVLKEPVGASKPAEVNPELATAGVVQEPRIQQQKTSTNNYSLVDMS